MEKEKMTPVVERKCQQILTVFMPLLISLFNIKSNLNEVVAGQRPRSVIGRLSALPLK